MNVQCSSDAMAGPMAIVEPLAPQGSPSKAVQGKSRGSLREDCPVEGYVALQGIMWESSESWKDPMLKASSSACAACG